MGLFRALLVAVFVVIVIYTGIVISRDGLNLIPVFFGDMMQLHWPGQFNLDFMCLLLLSGLWVSWRHQFSAGGIVLGIVAIFGGALFLSAYLLISSYMAGGNIRALLLGPSRS